jgi:hypothetical protein
MHLPFGISPRYNHGAYGTVAPCSDKRTQSANMMTCPSTQWVAGALLFLQEWEQPLDSRWLMGLAV